METLQMTREAAPDDVKAIGAIIARQFDSLSWDDGRDAKWSSFAEDFLPSARLYAAARPVEPQTVDAFVARMKALAASSLKSFNEAVHGIEVRVSGNVAIAIAGCEIAENGSNPSYNVEMMLLVKDQGIWRIAAQAWD